MTIEKKEIVRFSEIELRHVEVSILLMETLANNATNPNLVNDAKRAYDALVKICNYTEEEE